MEIVKKAIATANIKVSLWVVVVVAIGAIVIF